MREAAYAQCTRLGHFLLRVVVCNPLVMSHFGMDTLHPPRLFIIFGIIQPIPAVNSTMSTIGFRNIESQSYGARS